METDIWITKLYILATGSEHLINIPTYIIRGAGKQTHYEYEVKLNLPDDRWTLLRRYSRFRELHLKMKKEYGEKVSFASSLTLKL